MATIQDKYNDADAGAFGGSIVWPSNRYVSQSFTAASSYYAYSVKAKIYVDAGVTGTLNVTCSLFAVDGSGHPTGSALASKINSPGSPVAWTGTASAWYEFVLPTATYLTSGTEYAIVLYSATSGASTGWMADTTVTSDPGHLATSADGVTYAEVGADWACGFEVWSTTGNIFPTDTRYFKKLVAVCRNKMYTGATPATMAVIAASVDDIDCGLPLTIAEAYGKVFVDNETYKRVLDFTNIKLATATVDGGAGIPLYNDQVTGGSSGASMIVDYIDASSGACNIYGKRITEATFTSGETVTGTNSDGDAISFVISAAEAAGPHWYTWTSYANDTATYGSLPTASSKVFVTQGRVGLARDRLYPHQWWLSRQNNPWDWVFGVDDAQSAVAGNNTDAGQVGDIIVDAFPYKDAFVVFGCSSSYWYMTGNPCQGGTIEELDLTAGLLGPGAMCWDDADNFYTLSTKGLLLIGPGFTAPQNLTRDRYPDFVKDLAFDRATMRCTMSYDPINNGILITVVTSGTGVNVNWYYSLVSGGMFKDTYPNDGGVHSSVYFNAAAPTDQALVYGSHDGYIRYFNPASKNDADSSEDVAIDSYVSLGAIPLSTDARHDGVLSNIDLITGGGDSTATSEDSDPVTLTVFAERTAEQVIKSAVNNTNITLTKVITGPGLSRGGTEKRRARGRYGVIKLRNTTLGQSWALEHVDFSIKKAGKVR